MPEGRSIIDVFLVANSANTGADTLDLPSDALQIDQLSTGSSDSLRATDLDSSTQSPVITGVLNDEDGSMLALHFEYVTEAIDQLFKLASQIRSPATRKLRTDVDLYREIDADVRPTYIQMREKAERQGIEQILLQSRKALYRPEAEDADLESIQEDQIPLQQLQNDDRFLVQRLQRANHARRQQFEYWKRKKARSTKANLKAVEFTPFQPPVELQLARGQPKGLMHSALSATQPSAFMGSLPSSVPTLPQDFVLQENKSTYTATSRGLTVHGPSGEKVNWPKPPHEQKFRRDFECPLCFFFCPPRCLEEKAWRLPPKSECCQP